MGWKEGFNAALLRFVQEKLDSKAAEIRHFEQRTEERGYCDTCGYTTVVTGISYYDNDGRIEYKTWEGNFADLINELTE